MPLERSVINREPTRRGETYQSLLAIFLMPYPHRVHPQRHLLSLRSNPQDIIPQRELFLLRRAHPLTQGMQIIQGDGLHQPDQSHYTHKTSEKALTCSNNRVRNSS